MSDSMRAIPLRTSSSFWASGQRTVLLGAFLFTEVSFMVWVLLGVLSVHIARDLAWTSSQMGFLAATPILAGSLLRLPVGVLVDRFGPRRVGMGVLTLVALALLSLWQQTLTNTLPLLINAILLGLSGTAFSIAIPLVSRHYPPEHQGMALGLTAVGGGGTVVTALLAPRLAESFGWQAVFGMCIPPVLLIMGLFWFLNRHETSERSASHPWPHYLQAIRYGDSLWFAFFYAVTFGGFISLTASLVLYFHSHFQMTPTLAGELTALCIVGGALFRPVGGWAADRFGGIRTLQTAFSLLALTMLVLALGSTTMDRAMMALFIAMSGLGIGNGAIFQLIPLRFPRRMGVVTGLVGTAGGLGGFALVWGFGLFHTWSGHYGPGFLILAALAGVALMGLWSVRKQWRTTWGSPSRTRGRV